MVDIYDHPTWHAHIAATRADPVNVQHKLSAADWLDENNADDDPAVTARASYIRLAITLPDAPLCPAGGCRKCKRCRLTNQMFALAGVSQINQGAVVCVRRTPAAVVSRQDDEFVRSVSASFTQWDVYGDELMQREPVSNVAVRDWPPLETFHHQAQAMLSIRVRGLREGPTAIVSNYELTMARDVDALRTLTEQTARQAVRLYMHQHWPDVGVELPAAPRRLAESPL